MLGLLNKHFKTLCPYIKTYQERKTFLDLVTAVDITNAAQWFYAENEQEFFDWSDDFPCVAPPWPMAWFELKYPSQINSMGKIKSVPKNYFDHFGFMQQSIELPKHLQEKALIEDGAFEIIQGIWKEYLPKSNNILLKTMGERNERLSDLRRQHEKGWRARWITFFDIYGFLKKKCLPMVKVVGYIDPMGRWIPCHHMIFSHPQLAENIKRAQFSDDEAILQLQGFATKLLPVLFSLSLLHCKNVIIIDAPSPHHSIIKNRKKKGNPTIRYKQLIVEPLRQQVRYEQQHDNNDQDQIKRALHICRGHFKDYRDGKGLFGKYRDIYWWDMHVRGDKEIGEIHKSYKIQEKAPPIDNDGQNML